MVQWARTIYGSATWNRGFSWPHSLSCPMFNSNPAAPPSLLFLNPIRVHPCFRGLHPAPPAQDTLPEMAHGLPFSDSRSLPNATAGSLPWWACEDPHGEPLQLFFLPAFLACYHDYLQHHASAVSWPVACHPLKNVSFSRTGLSVSSVYSRTLSLGIAPAQLAPN